MRYTVINGKLVEPPPNAICWKYTDPIEKGRWVYDLTDRQEIEKEDPSLIEEIYEENNTI